jgi:hypothetical protein
VLKEITSDYVNYAKGAWRTVVTKYLIETENLEPAVTMIITDNWIEFTLRYIVDYKKRRSTRDKIFTRVLDEIGKTDGRVAIASTTLQLVEAPPLSVRITRETK